MRRLIALAAIYASQLGCLAVNTEKPTDGGDRADINCPPVPDMATPPPKCIAAKGLGGDNLLCVDFSAVSALTDPKLAGWDFTTNCGGNFWEVASGKLQIKNFASFSSNCGFLLPALVPADYQKYSTFTLSVIHAVDINPMRQGASIYLGAAQPSQTVTALPGTSPRQRQTHEIAKSALPNGGSNAYQPLLQITSTAPQGGYMGWQIESIAINGIP